MASRADEDESSLGCAVSLPLPPSPSACSKGKLGFQRLVTFSDQGLEGLGVVTHLGLLEQAETGSGRDQVTQDHILFQADQVIDLARESCFGQHLGRLLETRRRDEARTLHRSLGNTEQLRAGRGSLGLGTLGRLATESLDLRVDLFQHVLRYDGIFVEVTVSLVANLETGRTGCRSPCGTRTCP